MQLTEHFVLYFICKHVAFKGNEINVLELVTEHSLSVCAEQVGSIVNVTDLHLGGAQFESQPVFR